MNLYYPKFNIYLIPYIFIYSNSKSITIPSFNKPTEWNMEWNMILLPVMVHCRSNSWTKSKESPNLNILQLRVTGPQ